MLTCAHGAESAIKRDVADQRWRLAFSRPGFVTLKYDTAAEPPRGTFIRTSATSIGSGASESAATLIGGIRADLEARFATDFRFDQLHVWPRDRAPIGKFGFEPGVDEVSRAAATAVQFALADRWLSGDTPNRTAEPDESVLDVVLVHPSHWFWGHHRATDWPSRWPGGVQPIDPQYEPISRAYFKAAEAITWSGFDLRSGDLAVEIGSAPGGACGRLLELGLRVIGIDPAEMDPRIARHPRFRHIRARAGDLKRREFRHAKWLLVDSNVKPDKTLTTVENIVRHPSIELAGLLLTLKLGGYGETGLIEQWRRRIECWQPKSIRVRQLARNKCELCFAVAMR